MLDDATTPVPANKRARWGAAVAAAGLAALLSVAAAPAAQASSTHQGTSGHVTAPDTAAQAPAALGVAPAGKNLQGLTIDDTAGVLNQAKMRAAIDAIDFNEPTKVAIFTREGTASDNINTQTLLYAKAKHPEWISSSDSDKWADDLMIITLSVNARGGGQIGSYFGENRKLDTDAWQKSHDAARQQLRAAQYVDGIATVARENAGKMNRPWYKEPGLYIVGGGAAVLGGGKAGFIAIRRRGFQDRFESALKRGTTSMATVTTDLESTELAARTLPTSSPYAAQLEQRFSSFMETYKRDFTEQQQLEAVGVKERRTSAAAERSERFADSASDLDATDDALVDAAALYTRSTLWQEAWSRQVTPVREDLRSMQGVIADAQANAHDQPGLAAAVTAVESFAAEADAELTAIDAGVANQSVSIDEAFDRIKSLRERQTDLLRALSTAQIDAYAKSESEREAMQEEMERAQTSNRRGGSILDQISPTIFWSTMSYHHGYESGVSSVDSSRASAASSSSSSTTGYSGGGGSFSGSGGSSSF